MNDMAVSQLFRFPSAVKRDPAIEVWMHEHSGELGVIAQDWFELMRACGDDVRELLHESPYNAMHTNSATTSRFHLAGHGRGVGNGRRWAAQLSVVDATTR
jgi:hypothetical protein